MEVVTKIVIRFMHQNEQKEEKKQFKFALTCAQQMQCDEMLFSLLRHWICIYMCVVYVMYQMHYLMAKVLHVQVKFNDSLIIFLCYNLRLTSKTLLIEFIAFLLFSLQFTISRWLPDEQLQVYTNIFAYPCWSMLHTRSRRTY